MNVNISTCHRISDIYKKEVNNTSSTIVNAKATEKHTYEERQRERERHTHWPYSFHARFPRPGLPDVPPPKAP